MGMQDILNELTSKVRAASGRRDLTVVIDDTPLLVDDLPEPYLAIRNSAGDHVTGLTAAAIYEAFGLGPDGLDHDHVDR